MIKQLVAKLPPIRRLLEDRNRYFDELALSKIQNEEQRLRYQQEIEQLTLQQNECRQAWHSEKRDLSGEIVSLKQEHENKLNELAVLQTALNDAVHLESTLRAENLILQEQYAVLQDAHHTLEQSHEKIQIGIEGMSSSEYWEARYHQGGNSGDGSYRKLARFKADIVNDFIRTHEISSVIEMGCGDGNQLSLLNIKSYVGVDVSQTIVEKNQSYYADDPNKAFYLRSEAKTYKASAYDLALSMDVIFHLLEDEVFYDYMHELFSLSSQYVIIYSSNHESYTQWGEFRHRNFTGYVQDHFSQWLLIKYIPNRYPYMIGQETATSCSDFYIFEKKN